MLVFLCATSVFSVSSVVQSTLEPPRYRHCMKPIATPEAPAAIGPYSQAVRAGDTVYLSGQIPLDPKTMQIVEGFDNQVRRVFDNLQAVCRAAGGDFDKVVRVTVHLTDLANFARVNEIMATYFKEP